MNLEAAHIFFPKKFLNSKGFLIGFNISGFLITVIHVQDTIDVNYKWFSEIKRVFS